MSVTVDDVRLEVEIDSEDIQRCAERDRCEQWMLPLYQAGEWISRRMMREGASEQETKDLSFALGQIIRMRGIDQSFEVAAECFNRWLEGDPDKPGWTLGRRLLESAEVAARKQQQRNGERR